MIDTKIKSARQLKHIIRSIKRKNKKIAFTNGCFDILHYGHAKYLEEAKKKADVLIVGINTDASVKKIKGRSRPIIGENDRARLVAALESVDYVCLFNQTTPLSLIKQIRPDVIIKGADWKAGDIVGSDFVSSYGGKVSTVALIQARSTTSIIEKIAKKF